MGHRNGLWGINKLARCVLWGEVVGRVAVTIGSPERVFPGYYTGGGIHLRRVGKFFKKKICREGLTALAKRVSLDGATRKRTCPGDALVCSFQISNSASGTLDLRVV
jgi:hypothetical protein